MGPFCHLLFAAWQWPRLAPGLGLDQAQGDAFSAGALAPDAGYYPGGEPALAEQAHREPGDALWSQAHDARERAFALGWRSHMILDGVGHPRLVDVAAGGDFSRQPLAHKRVEWGMDAWMLGRPENQWLWAPQVDPEAGLELWQRVLAPAGGAPALAKAQKSQLAMVAKLPRVWWLTGLLSRPGHGWGNRLGRGLGTWPRRLLVAWFARQGSLDPQAVLNPLAPGPAELALWQEVQDAAASQLGAEVQALTPGRKVS